MNSTTIRSSPNIPGGRRAAAYLTMATVTSASNQYINLAKSLPAKLQRFLARYPPSQIVIPDAPKTGYQTDTVNPFYPKRHPETGRMHNPIYSARRQADLVKLARDHGVEELLPTSTKKTEVRLAHKVRYGWRGKGTGVGQKVKGHLHERQLAAKYVLFRSLGAEVVSGRWLCRTSADLMYQDGQEERGYAQDAGTHQRMEGGTFDDRVVIVSRSSTNTLYRLVGRTGPNGPNRELYIGIGLPLDVQTCINSVYQKQTFAISHFDGAFISFLENILGIARPKSICDYRQDLPLRPRGARVMLQTS